MKKIILAVFALWLVGFAAGMASAEPYFKPIDPNHPQWVTGVFDDLKGHSDAGFSLALFTHKGPIDWTPLAFGGSLGKGLGGPSISLGTSINILPNIKAALRNTLIAMFPNESEFSNIKVILAPPAPGSVDITMTLGPQGSLVFYDGLKSRGVITLFYGAAWKF